MNTADWIKQMTALLGSAIILAFVVNAISPRGIPWQGQWDESQGVVTADQGTLQPTLDFEISDVPTAQRLLAAGQVTFVDARPVADYREGHLPGAVSLPVGDFDHLIEDFRRRFGQNDPIATYCSGRSCQDSHILAQRLFAEGYTNVSVFIDGYPGWAAEGYPIETP